MKKEVSRAILLVVGLFVIISLIGSVYAFSLGDIYYGNTAQEKNEIKKAITGNALLGAPAGTIQRITCPVLACASPAEGCSYGPPKYNKKGCQINCGSLNCENSGGGSGGGVCYYDPCPPVSGTDVWCNAIPEEVSCNDPSCNLGACGITDGCNDNNKPACNSFMGPQNYIAVCGNGIWTCEVSGNGDGNCGDGICSPNEKYQIGEKALPAPMTGILADRAPVWAGGYCEQDCGGLQTGQCGDGRCDMNEMCQTNLLFDTLSIAESPVDLLNPPLGMPARTSCCSIDCGMGSSGGGVPSCGNGVCDPGEACNSENKKKMASGSSGGGAWLNENDIALGAPTQLMEDSSYSITGNVVKNKAKKTTKNTNNKIKPIAGACCWSDCGGDPNLGEGRTTSGGGQLEQGNECGNGVCEGGEGSPMTIMGAAKKAASAVFIPGKQQPTGSCQSDCGGEETPSPEENPGQQPGGKPGKQPKQPKTPKQPGGQGQQDDQEQPGGQPGKPNKQRSGNNEGIGSEKDAQEKEDEVNRRAEEAKRAREAEEEAARKRVEDEKKRQDEANKNKLKEPDKKPGSGPKGLGVCGNGICEEGESLYNCVSDCFT